MRRLLVIGCWLLAVVVQVQAQVTDAFQSITCDRPADEEESEW